MRISHKIGTEVRMVYTYLGEGIEWPKVARVDSHVRTALVYAVVLNAASRQHKQSRWN